MLILIKIIIMIAVCIAFSFLAGNTACGVIRLENAGIAQRLVLGFFTIAGIYELLYIPLMLMYGSLMMLTVLWGIAVLMIAVAGIIRFRPGIVKAVVRAGHLKAGLKPVHIAAVIAVAIYLVISILNQQEYWDDAFFAAISSTSAATDTIIQYHPYTGAPITISKLAKYAFSAYPVMVASLSKLFGLHTLIILHIVIPVMLIPLHYCLVYMLAADIFGKSKEACAVVIITVFLNMFSLYIYVEATTSYWLYIGSWFGKSLTGNIAVPALWHYLIMAMDGKKSMDNAVSAGEPVSRRCWAAVFMVQLGAVSFSTYGSIAALSVTACITLYYMIRDRRLSYAVMALGASIPSIAVAAATYIMRL